MRRGVEVAGFRLAVLLRTLAGALGSVARLHVCLARADGAAFAAVDAAVTAPRRSDLVFAARRARSPGPA